jgi:hypothetical protein
MRVSSLLPLLTLLLACGAGPAQHAPKVAPPRVAQSRPTTRAELPGFGLSAEFPCSPVATTDHRQFRMAQLTCGDPQSFTLWSMSTGGADRASDGEWFESVRASLKLKKLRDVQVQSFDGVELGGVYEGRNTLLRLLAVGDSLLVAQVDAKHGPMDEASAGRFFASLQLQLPWRIYASPTTKFSVMVPAHAIEIDRPMTTAPDSRSNSRGFFLGGRAVVWYWAGAREIVDRNPDVTVDQILDASVDSIRQNGNEIVWQAPIESPSSRGREFLSKGASGTLRGRVWLTEHFVYVLMVGAKSRDAIDSADAARFYASFVYY